MKKEDLQKYKMLKSVIAQGEYKIKGEALIAVANLFAWFNSIEGEFHDSPSVKPEIKKEPIKKMSAK